MLTGLVQSPSIVNQLQNGVLVLSVITALPCASFSIPLGRPVQLVLRERPLLRPPLIYSLQCCFTPIEGVCSIARLVNEYENTAVILSNEASLYRSLYKRAETRVEAIYVEQYNRLCMNLKLRPRRHFHYFFKCLQVNRLASLDQKNG